MPKGVEVKHAAIDDSRTDAFVIRGTIPAESLELLQVASYQREAGSLAKLTEIMNAIKKGVVLQDIVLGMRGANMDTEKGIILLDPVYIVDGYQRITAARHVMKTNPELIPKINVGAAVYFNTDESSERELFRILNTKRSKLSPNILLRNMQHDNDAIKMFLSLCGDGGFVLKDKVVWEQSMRRGQLITALMLLKAAGVLHSHLGPGMSSNIEELAKSLNKTMGLVGKKNFRENVKTFFDALDQCWGIRTITHAQMAPHLKENFLKVFARYLSKHEAFWKTNNLSIAADLMAKIKTFNLYDPTVVNLCGSSGKSQYMLYQMIRDHVNSGKRSKRLVERKVDGDDAFANGSEDEAEEVGEGGTPPVITAQK